MQQLLDGLKFVRNRITHAVNEVGYISARAKNPSSFEAHWTWQSLPPGLIIGGTLGEQSTRRRLPGTTSSRRSFVHLCSSDPPSTGCGPIMGRARNHRARHEPHSTCIHDAWPLPALQHTDLLTCRARRHKPVCVGWRAPRGARPRRALH